MGGKGSGRKPDPTRLRIVKGNPGKRPMPVDEPQPDTPSEVIAPAWLSDDAGELYEKLGSELIALELLTVLDLEILAVYCEAWTLYIEAVESIASEGAVVWVDTATCVSQRRPNPWIAIKKQEVGTLMQVAARFGLTPSDRVGMHTGQVEAMTDPLSELAARNRAKREQAAASAG